ncbi:MAG: CoA transferase [SAR86 cluster bacterium]|nr:CoA transferase [SAR86 cluster bacterium]
MDNNKGILHGYRVLDFGRYIAGPFCGTLLGDYGAEVIRVERVKGSEDRYLQPVTDKGEGSMFLQLNRNKLGFTLNPTKPEGKSIVEKLVKTADIVIANLPDSTLKAMHLDYESLEKVNPKIILTSNTAFGTTGPYSDRVGFDGVAQAMSGAMNMTGDPDIPLKAFSPYVDFCTASLAAYGTLLAILERQKTGKGQRVQTSLLSTALTMTNSHVMEQKLLKKNRIATRNRSQTSAPADTFQTKDGWVLVHTVGQPLFERWAELIGEPEWISDPRFKDDISRGDHGEIISNRMAKWCKDKTNKEVLNKLDKARIPGGEVLRAKEVLEEQHIIARNLFLDLEYANLKEPAPIMSPAVELSENPGHINHSAPLLGEHTETIMIELGYTKEEIKNLKNNKII